jgi:hypothetical protein
MSPLIDVSARGRWRRAEEKCLQYQAEQGYRVSCRRTAEEGMADILSATVLRAAGASRIYSLAPV